MRPTTDPFIVRLLVERAGKPVTEYLCADGTTGPDEEAAVRFRTYTSATMLERDRITRLTHDYAGGLREYLDLEKGCEQARLVVLRQVEAGLWPKGRPTAEGEELLAQNERIATAWATFESIEKDGYETMRSMLDRVIFLATWRVLVVSPPDGWGNLADRPGLDEGVFYAIWHAWIAATEASRAGK